MYTDQELNQAFHDALSVVSYKGGYDTFAFRQVFQTLSTQEKEDIYNYLKKVVPEAKDSCISSDHYSVTLQTLAEIMSGPLSLISSEEKNDSE